MTVEFTPRPYQKLIRDYVIANPRGFVLASMGMGKTSALLSAISALLLLEDGPVLVLAPLAVARDTWPEEAAKWAQFAHLRVSKVIGDIAARKKALRTEADIYTMNYDNLPWLQEHFGEHWPFKIVIADESTRLKSFRTRQGGVRTRALSRVAHTQVRRFIALTGTFAPNGLLDTWGQAWFIDRGVRLGRTYSAFRERWFTTGYDGYSVVPTAYAGAQISAALSDVCIVVDAKDWFDFKEPIVNNINVELPPSVRAIYRDMEVDFYAQIQGHKVEVFNTAAKSQKLSQIASGAVYTDKSVDDDTNPGARSWQVVHDAKLDTLESIIEEASGAPVLVAYHFKSDRARLQKRFKHARCLSGDKTAKKDWNEGKIQLLLAHPKNAGHGINLQDGGNILVFFSHDWSLENRLQIIERIGPVRQLQSGHDRPVFIYNIVAKNTIDEDVIARADGKCEVQDALIQGIKRRLGVS